MKSFLLIVLLALAGNCIAQDKIASYTVKAIQQIHFYWKNESRQNFFTINSLNKSLSAKKQPLLFAMNGGMFDTGFAPVGLYIEKKQQLKKLNHVSGGGNFGLKPNGVFYITTKNKAAICKTEDFKNDGTVNYATQSGRCW